MVSSIIPKNPWITFDPAWTIPALGTAGILSASSAVYQTYQAIYSAKPLIDQNMGILDRIRIWQAVRAIPVAEQKNVIARISTLNPAKINAPETARMISVLGEFSDLDWEEVAEPLRLLIPPGTWIYSAVKILEHIVTIPRSDQKNIIQAGQSLIQTQMTSVDTIAILSAISDIPKAERASLINLALPLLKRTDRGIEKAEILNIIRRTHPEKRQIVVERTLTQLNDDPKSISIGRVLELLQLSPDQPIPPLSSNEEYDSKETALIHTATNKELSKNAYLYAQLLFTDTCLSIACRYISILAHETGHAIAAQGLFLNANPSISIHLSGSKGFTEFSSRELNEIGNLLGYQNALALTYIAGPLVNLIVGMGTLAIEDTVSKQGRFYNNMCSASMRSIILYVIIDLILKETLNGDYSTFSQRSGIDPNLVLATALVLSGSILSIRAILNPEQFFFSIIVFLNSILVMSLLSDLTLFFTNY